jgi:adenine deaminase
MKQVSGNIVDIHSREIYPGTIYIKDDRICEIRRDSGKYPFYIIPGLVDAHVHIESSMLIPSEFSKVAIRQGTVATVSDPHEIANVLGVEGVKFMIDDAKSAALKFFWGIPSCVPATTFETAGASINSDDMQSLFSYPEIVCLAEMMNFPGVIHDFPEVRHKLHLAIQNGFPIDGHAPGLSGDFLRKYITSGISTDHECTNLQEALEKIEKGMIIQIRNGSSAKNFAELFPLIDRYPDKVMLCCDDIHPEDLLIGHINAILKLGVEQKIDLFNLLRAATYNPIKHYNLPVGLLQVDDLADFCIVHDLKEFKIIETWINGDNVYSNKIPIPAKNHSTKSINQFISYTVNEVDLQIPNQRKNFKAIGVRDGELLTDTCIIENSYTSDYLSSDTSVDLLKIAVINRYRKEKPALGFVKNFGLKEGAIASSVAHDSHNIIVVGVSDSDMVTAINKIMESQGGIVAVNGDRFWHLPLPVAGLMSVSDAKTVAGLYLDINQKAKDFGSTLKSPFMTLSFMALLVIPELKLSDRGLFDGLTFEFTSLYV